MAHRCASDSSGRPEHDPWWVYLLYPLARLHYALCSAKPNVFHKILDGKMKTEILYEDDMVMAFRDIFPLGRVHLLVIPKEHVHSWPHLKSRHKDLVRHIKQVGVDLMKKEDLAEEECLFGFMTPPFNSVMQLHMHCISLPLRETSAFDKIRIACMLSTTRMVTPEQVLAGLDKRKSCSKKSQ